MSETNKLRLIIRQEGLSTWRNLLDLQLYSIIKNNGNYEYGLDYDKCIYL